MKALRKRGDSKAVGRLVACLRSVAAWTRRGLKPLPFDAYEFGSNTVDSPGYQPGPWLLRPGEEQE